MPTSRPTRGASALVLVGILALAFNLRPAAVSVGPVLGEVRRGLGMSPTVAGVLTTLPVLAFAVFGALAPRAARVFGVHRTALGALVLVVIGLGLRSEAHTIPLFLAWSVLALAGMAAANVLLPALIKLHFPNRIGLLSSLYTTSLAVGLTLASTVTVPISNLTGSWRWGLFAWAGTAALAVLPWIALVRHDQALERTPARYTLGDVARTRLGWAMAVLFGLQSLQAYAVFGWFAQLFEDSGYSATTAGYLLGATTAASIPVSLWVPSYAARLERQRGLFAALLSTYILGYGGLLIAPHAGAWLWAVLVGIGSGVFPLVLTLIGLRARTDGGTTALSGFTQSAGYLLAMIGPFGVGFLYGHSGGWTVPLIFLLVMVVPLFAVAMYVGLPRYLEDEPALARTSGD